jgi:hypothetical protein
MPRASMAIDWSPVLRARSIRCTAPMSRPNLSNRRRKARLPRVAATSYSTPALRRWSASPRVRGYRIDPGGNRPGRVRASSRLQRKARRRWPGFSRPRGQPPATTAVSQRRSPESDRHGSRGSRGQQTAPLSTTTHERRVRDAFNELHAARRRAAVRASVDAREAPQSRACDPARQVGHSH